MDLSGAGDHLAVAVDTGAHVDVRVSTSFEVARWDAEQVAWAGREYRRKITDDVPGGWEPGGRAFAAIGLYPYSRTREDNCNNLVSTGWQALLSGWTATYTALTHQLSSSYGRIGVGTSSAAVAWGQTYLQGDTGSSSTTSYYQLVSGAPTWSVASSPATVVLTASFASGNANFAWQEFGTDNANASGVYLNGLAGGYIFLNRGLSSQGTKTSGQVWTATETISFGYNASVS